MKTKREHLGKNSQESGNILVYVLIAVALFAALGFTVSRQTQNSSTSELDKAKAEFFATQLISYASQTKSVIDQMMFTGTSIDELDFVTPEESGFNTSPHIHKVYHPEGGGLSPANLPALAMNQITTTPEPAGWYLGRFNNIEWTNTTGTDVMLTAHQISKQVCALINEKVTGSKTIPAISTEVTNYLIDTATDTELTATACASCEGYMSLCVSNAAATAFSFYTVLADR